jgi:hypothetical protein
MILVRLCWLCAPLAHPARRAKPDDLGLVAGPGKSATGLGSWRRVLTRLLLTVPRANLEAVGVNVTPAVSFRL